MRGSADLDDGGIDHGVRPIAPAGLAQATFRPKRSGSSLPVLPGSPPEVLARITCVLLRSSVPAGRLARTLGGTVMHWPV